MLRPLLYSLLRLRLSDPWRYKFPFIFSALGLVMFWGQMPFAKAGLMLLSSMVLMFGFAGFGYLTNDWADVEKDKLAGKQNSLEGSSGYVIGLLLFLSLLFIILPWLVLQFNLISLLFIICEIFLFCLYSFKPFRWKERGALGLIADTLYAHTLPVLFAIHTYYLASPFKFDFYGSLLLLFGLWQTVLGVRNILLHQLADFDNDSKADVKTFLVTNNNIVTVQGLMERVFIPSEAILFLALLLFISWKAKMFFGLLYLIFLVFRYIQKRRELPFKNVRDWFYCFADDFYYTWFPAGIFLLCCMHDIRFGIFLFAYLLAFAPFNHLFFKRQ